MSQVQRNGTGLSAEFAQKNTNTPAAATDIANKAYVDAVAQGLSIKASVRAATTGVLPANAYLNGVSGVGATITKTAPFATLPAQDGVTLLVGDRLLVKDETGGNAPNNGIYLVTSVGSGVAPWILTRALDNDEATEFPGAFTFVEEGTVNASAGFVCTTPAPVIVGTTPIVWTQFSGAGQITAGAGLTKTGNTLNVGTGDGIQVDADSVTVKLDGATLAKGASGLKVADSTFVKADGTVAFAADQSMGSHKLTSVTDPASAQDAATKAYVDALADTGIVFFFDGGGSALAAGKNINLYMPFKCTILSATLLADQSGSAAIDVRKGTYSTYNPSTGGSSIVASAAPTISSATKSQDTTLTGWTTAIAADDTLQAHITSVTTCTQLTLTLKVKKIT